MFNIYGRYFFGNEISEYGLEHNRVDYATLAKAFDAVLANNIISDTCEIGYWEQISGFVDNSDEIDAIDEKIDDIETRMEMLEVNNLECSEAYETLEAERDKLNDEREQLEYEEETPEIYQFYIVSSGGADILEECNEIVFYNDTLDMYVWGVTHFGTSWNYVLTDIPCNTGDL